MQKSGFRLGRLYDWCLTLDRGSLFHVKWYIVFDLYIFRAILKISPKKENFLREQIYVQTEQMGEQKGNWRPDRIM